GERLMESVMRRYGFLVGALAIALLVKVNPSMAENATKAATSPDPVANVFEDGSHIRVVDSLNGDRVVPLSLDPFPAVPGGTYEYTVHHARAGRVGTYSNTVTINGSETIVETDVNLRAKILFMTVAREQAERRQVWRDGRLVEFESVTRDKGDDRVTTGRAKGDSFVIEGGRGEQFVAPANVFPTNPWTMHILRAGTLMGEKNGTLHPIREIRMGTETIEFDSDVVETRYFKVSGDREKELWYDENGVPVRFTIMHGGDLVTFTLNR
ncbi:MAG: DUF6134 family protein, partial [Sphingomonadales bacterium]